MSEINPSFKWYMLALLTATGTFVVAIPFSCMPVLFKEISQDLNLSLVQIGTIWGIASLAGLFVSIIAGVLGDRFGMKAIIAICGVLVGISGALRGLSTSFMMLAALVFINGLVRLILPVNMTKAIGLWFRGKYLGMAMGVSAMGVGLGLMLGPMISATILSPWLGGWRNVLYLIGGVSLGVGILWLIFGKDPEAIVLDERTVQKVPFRQSFSKLVRNKALWLLAIAAMFRIGSISGMIGYLPLYLRDKGWAPASADGTLAVFFAVSTICVIPISLLSDRIRSRKAILIPGLIAPAISLSLIPSVSPAGVWVLMIITGIFMDSFMATMVTSLLETEGVGTVYAGTAIGMVFTVTQIGSIVSPPLGNSLAAQNPGSAFYFWAVLSAIGLVVMFFTTETGKRIVKIE